MVGSEAKKIASLGALFGLLFAGTAFLFFAISTTTIDGYPMPQLVFYSTSNFIVFSLPTFIFSYYLYLARNSYVIIVLSGILIVCWDIEIIMNYIGNEFRCTYWHQGDFLCGTFDGMLFVLIIADFCLLVSIAVRATVLGTRIGFKNKAIAAVLALLLALDSFVILIS